MPAATAPDIGHGTIAEFSVDEGTTFVKFARMEAVEFPNPTFDDVDFTHFESPGRAKEYGAGLVDNGEVSITVQHLPGSAIDVLMRDNLGTTGQLQLTENGGDPEVFEATIKSYQRNIPMDDKKVAVITLRIGAEITGGGV